MPASRPYLSGEKPPIRHELIGLLSKPGRALITKQLLRESDIEPSQKKKPQCGRARALSADDPGLGDWTVLRQVVSDLAPSRYDLDQRAVRFHQP